MSLHDCLTMGIATKEAARLERNYQIAEGVKAAFPINAIGNHRFFDGDQSLLFEAD